MNTVLETTTLLSQYDIKADVRAMSQKINCSLHTIEALHTSEGKHFWPILRQYLVVSLLKKFGKTHCTFLDVGCGSGGLLQYVERVLPQSTVAGMDGYLEPLVNCRTRSKAAKLYLQDIAMFPWVNTGEKYDAISFMDVLEHLDRPEAALEEATHHMGKDGIVIVSLPARDELWSKRDAFLGHRQRYDVHDVRALIEKNGLEIIHLNYVFSYLYFPMWIIRKFFARVFRVSDTALELGELKVIPVLNGLIVILGKIEIALSMVLPLPIGTSVYCVAKKKH